MSTSEDGRPPVTYTYTIRLEDGSQMRFAVTLDGETLSLLPPPATSPAPEWTRLAFHQCPNCPLRPETHERCPVAANLVPVIEAFRDRRSFEPVEVSVESQHRTYARKAGLQTAISPLLGLHMVTSGCPVMDRLRPLVETHLPFMSRRETQYRMLSLHLMSQFFAERRGEPVEVGLDRLRETMEAVHEVNVAFCNRLRAITEKDASINAIVILSTLGDFPDERLVEQDLERLERLSREYYERTLSDAAPE
jgi:hypothetical protein